MKTVFDTFAKTFPAHVDNLALSWPNLPGWFHLSNRAKEPQQAKAFFLCAIHKKFGVVPKDGMTFALVFPQNIDSASVPQGDSSRTKPPFTERLDGFFKQLETTITAPEVLPSYGMFALTTEIEIGKMKPLLEGAPTGMFVTVGGERAFRGAALLDTITALLIFDYDARTVRFNQINAKLLKAPDLQTYRQLRWQAPFSAWQKLDPTLTADDFKFWRGNVATSSVHDGLAKLGERLNQYGDDQVSEKFSTLTLAIKQGIPLSSEDKIWYDKVKAGNKCAKLSLSDPDQPFLEAGTYLRFKLNNYLFDETLFQRLHNLAVNQRIFSVAANLADSATQDAIIKAFNDFTIDIAVLDLDNTYLPSYLGTRAYARLVQGLIPRGSNESRLIAMANFRTENSRYTPNQACSHSHYNAYFAFTFELLKRYPPILSEQALIHEFGKHKKELDQNNWQDIKLFRVKN